MDFVSSDQLVAGMNAWVLDKKRPLGAHLSELDAIDPETVRLIDALVDKHVREHGGSVERSLASLPEVKVPERLASIVDPDLQASLVHIPAAPTGRADNFATVAMPTAQPGDASRYTVLRPHAAGGLGQVSVARDAELNREVALKELLDRHADDSNSRARFLQEAEITGGLEHPGVVPIYGLGQYPDGRPFYAMRFIRGNSLRQAVDEFHVTAEGRWNKPGVQLQLRRLLSRMIDVCNAVEYAHSRGVVHRDLKPSNVMLGRYGETLVVDWGLAKAVGQSDHLPRDERRPLEALLTPQSGSGSAPTQMGAALGTPAFMSPEQAAGRIDQLGPASDVYSLGATLYMVLTGRAPQEDDDLGEVLQRVQQGKFPRPREHNPAIPKPLEAICLKAMAQAPADRYDSAQQMGVDLEAWLADEPVGASPEPLTTRVRRWVKRHLPLVASVAAAATVLLISLAIGLVLLNRAKDDALAAKDAALSAENEAESQRQRAEELLELAQSSLTHFEELSQSEQLRAFGMENLRSELLETSVRYYATLANVGGESEQARSDRAHAYYRLGGTYQQIGKIGRAIDAYKTGLDQYEALGRDYPEAREYKIAEAMLRASLGDILVYNQRAKDAAPYLREARQQLSALLNEQPELDEVRRQLAYVTLQDGERLRQTGDMEQADAAYQQSIETLDAADLESLSPAQWVEYRSLRARVLIASGAILSGGMWRFDAALERFEEAESILAELFAEHPDYGNVGFSLAQVRRNIGFLYAQQNMRAETIEHYQQGIDVLTQVEAQYPGVLDYRREMADLQQALGMVEIFDGRQEVEQRGIERVEEAVAIAEEILAQSPLQSQVRINLARYQAWLGNAYSIRDEGEKAAEYFRAALDALEQVADDSDMSVDQQFEMGNTLFLIAERVIQLEKFDEALPVLEEAAVHVNAVVEQAPELVHPQMLLARIDIGQGQCYSNAGRMMEAVRRCDSAAQTIAMLSEKPDSAPMQATLSMLAAGTKFARTYALSSLRNGHLTWLLENRGPQLAVEQAEALADYTDQASDHYLAAETLAKAAVAVVQPDEPPSDPEKLGAPASVDEAEQAEQSENVDEPDNRGDPDNGDDPDRDDASSVVRELDPTQTEAASEASATGESSTSPAAEEPAAEEPAVTPSPEELAERYAAAAVTRLRRAWQGGYLKRKPSLTDRLTGAPSLATVRRSETFAILLDRQDYAELVREIEAGPPQD